jgi:ABC-type uncharacterized transport system permease subunit
MHDLWDKFWRDEEGRVVIWQTPNAWLIGWATATFVSLFFNGRTADVLTFIGSVSLIVWSVLEVTKGANYFRRLLGLVVLIFSIASLIKSL